jgi:hypothetical protein
MFQRILVVLENAKIEQNLCQAALKLAKEMGARVRWVHLLQPLDSGDFAPLSFLHQQALLLYGIESDITQMTGELVNVVRRQVIQWSPDLLLIGQQHFQEISPLFSSQQSSNRDESSGREFPCSVMIVPTPMEPENPPVYTTQTDQLSIKPARVMIAV